LPASSGQARDKKRLDACTKTLAQGAPQDPKTLSFRWSYAMLRHDYGEARSLIAELKKAGCRNGDSKLTTATADASAWWRRPATYGRRHLPRTAARVAGRQTAAARARARGERQPRLDVTARNGRLI